MFNKAFLLDLLERSVWTFLQAGSAVLIVDGMDDISMAALKTALVAGGIAVVKGLIASRVGNSNTAQALPGVESAYVNEPSAP